MSIVVSTSSMYVRKVKQRWQVAQSLPMNDGTFANKVIAECNSEETAQAALKLLSGWVLR